MIVSRRFLGYFLGIVAAGTYGLCRTPDGSLVGVVIRELQIYERRHCVDHAICLSTDGRSDRHYIL